MKANRRRIKVQSYLVLLTLLIGVSLSSACMSGGLFDNRSALGGADDSSPGISEGNPPGGSGLGDTADDPWYGQTHVSPSDYRGYVRVWGLLTDPTNVPLVDEVIVVANCVHANCDASFETLLSAADSSQYIKSDKTELDGRFSVELKANDGDRLQVQTVRGNANHITVPRFYSRNFGAVRPTVVPDSTLDRAPLNLFQSSNGHIWAIEERGLYSCFKSPATCRQENNDTSWKEVIVKTEIKDSEGTSRLEERAVFRGAQIQALSSAIQNGAEVVYVVVWTNTYSAIHSVDISSNHQVLFSTEGLYPQSTWIDHIEAVADGGVWFTIRTTGHHEVRYLNGDIMKIFDLGGSTAEGLIETESGEILVATASHLYRLDEVDYKLHDILRDSLETIAHLVATPSGVALAQQNGENRVSYYEQNDKGELEQIFSLRPPTPGTIALDDQLSFRTVRSIAFDLTTNRMFVATKGPRTAPGETGSGSAVDVVSLHGGRIVTRIDTAELAHGEDVNSVIVIDGGKQEFGEVWVLTERGMYKLRIPSFHNLDPSASSANAATLKNTQAVVYGTNALIPFGELNGLSGQYIYSSRRVGNTIFVATATGLSIIQDDQVFSFRFRDGSWLPADRVPMVSDLERASNRLKQVHLDQRGNIWIASEQGLHQFRVSQTGELQSRYYPSVNILDQEGNIQPKTISGQMVQLAPNNKLYVLAGSDIVRLKQRLMFTQISAVSVKQKEPASSNASIELSLGNPDSYLAQARVVPFIPSGLFEYEYEKTFEGSFSTAISFYLEPKSDSHPEILWVGHAHYGICWIDTQNSDECVKATDALPDHWGSQAIDNPFNRHYTFVMSINQSPDGRLMFGSLLNGLFFLDASGVFTQAVLPDPPSVWSFPIVMDITPMVWEESADELASVRMVLGTDMGLIIVDNSDVGHAISEEDLSRGVPATQKLLPGEGILDMTVDVSKNELINSTEQGVAVWSLDFFRPVATFTAESVQ